MTEERISECEGRAIEITQLEKQREKRLTKNEQSFRHLQDNIKKSNICIIGVAYRKEKDGFRKVFEEMMKTT